MTTGLPPFWRTMDDGSKKLMNPNGLFSRGYSDIPSAAGTFSNTPWSGSNDPQREQLDRMTRTPWNGRTEGNSPWTPSEERIVRQFQDEMRMDRQRNERDIRYQGDEIVRLRTQIHNLTLIVKELTDDKKKREDAAAAQIAQPTPAAAAEAIEASTKRPRKTEPVDPDADVDDKLNK
jgi:TolA-binding protein